MARQTSIQNRESSIEYQALIFLLLYNYVMILSTLKFDGIVKRQFFTTKLAENTENILFY